MLHCCGLDSARLRSALARVAAVPPTWAVWVDQGRDLAVGVDPLELVTELVTCTANRGAPTALHMLVFVCVWCCLWQAASCWQWWPVRAEARVLAGMHDAVDTASRELPHLS